MMMMPWWCHSNIRSSSATEMVVSSTDLITTGMAIQDSSISNHTLAGTTTNTNTTTTINKDDSYYPREVQASINSAMSIVSASQMLNQSLGVLCCQSLRWPILYWISSTIILVLLAIFHYLLMIVKVQVFKNCSFFIFFWDEKKLSFFILLICSDCHRG